MGRDNVAGADDPGGLAPSPSGTPQPTPSTPTATAATPGADHALRPGTVLVVDPDPDILQSTGQLVEEMGYLVLRLAEADDVLETVDREQPDLVLLEVKMPGLNVAGLLAALRSNPRTSRIPVAFFSASYELPSIAARHQAWGYLAKPFGYHELSRLLERALGPPLGESPMGDLRHVEAELRTQFRDARNVLAALTNYITVLSRRELDEPSRAAVARLEDLVLTLEGRHERLRSYVLALLGPVEPVPRSARPKRERERERGPTREADRAPAGGGDAAKPARASSPPAQTLEERRRAAREALLGRR